jgi:hypothetical protein
MHEIELLIGEKSGDHVSIMVVGRENQDCDWLRAKISVSAGAWSGDISESIDTDSLVSFRQQLQALYSRLEGKAKFEPIEPSINLTLKGDRLGHIVVSGVADDQPAIGNKLHFHFDLDQTYLPLLVSQIQMIENAYPIVGKL